MAASSWRAVISLIILATGCATPNAHVKRIALLAPFESTYREVGYDALYPVKLALADEALTDIQVLSVDDGGSIENAIIRAHGLAADPTINLALVVGPIATDQRVLDALVDVPVVVIGDWNVTPTEGVFILSSDEIAAQVSTGLSSVYEAAGLDKAAGGEIFGLRAFKAISQSLSNITVFTSAAPPPPEFRERLLASDLFVPEPGLLATTAYDAGTLAARVVAQTASRAEVLARIRTVRIDGINGEISFDENGYWADAPVYRYSYNGGILTRVDP